MSLFDVCRLCSSKNNLVWVFNRENKTDLLIMEDLEEVVFVTTGVEIHKKDMISQKICDKCTQFTTTMFKFRKKCEENDKQLKDMCMQLLKINDMRIPNTDVTIKHEKGTKDKSKEELAKVALKVHPTIADLFRTYPRLKLPTSCLNQNVAPFVSMPLDEVENYFKNHNLNFDEPIKFTLESEQADTKKVANIDCDSGSITSNLEINAEIISDRKKEDNAIIRPIKFRIFSLDCVNKIIVDDVDASVKNLNNNDYNEATSNICKRTSSTNHLNVPEHERLHRKRKISNESAQNAIVRTSPISNSEKSDPSYICDICNSVDYKSKDLKHQCKHCEFCKMKFLNLESKLLHLENMCIIKKTIENLPNVEAQKIEYNIEIRRKYPEAFSNFPALPALENEPNVINSSCKNLKSLKTVESLTSTNINSLKTGHQCAKMPVTAEDTVEVIDISSDDDDVIPITDSTSTKTHTSNTILEKKTSNHVVATSVAGVVNNNIPAASNAIIKPDVKIKNISILNNVNPKMSDAEVLRMLLVNKSLKLFSDTDAQTFLPTNQSIRIHSHNHCAELKKLKRTLHAYKVPVVMKLGPFSVLYDYKINSTQPKRLHLWNDLSPIDIKTKEKKIIIHQNVIHRNGKIKDGVRTFKSLSVKNNAVSISHESIGDEISLDDYVETRNPSTSKPRAIISRSSSVSSHTNSFVSNITRPQNARQYSSTSNPQAITTPTPVSPHTNSFVSDITLHQYSSNSNPQAITTPSPTSLHTNSFVSDSTLPQHNVHQYSSNSNPQAITTPSPVLSHTNSFVSNVSLPQQNAQQYPSSSKPQTVTTPSPTLLHTNSFVSDTTLPQHNVHQYSSNSIPQAITTPNPVLSHTDSFVSNITRQQQNVHQYSSSSNLQAITAPSPVSSHTISFVSNITHPQQNVQQYPSSSKPQTVTTPSPTLRHTNSFVSDIMLPQHNVHQYSSTSKPQAITTPIPVSSHTNSFVSNNTHPPQNVHQYFSTSKPRVMTAPSSVSSYRNGYEGPSFSKFQELMNTPIPLSTSTNSSISNISDPLQDLTRYSSNFEPGVITTSIPVSTCTTSSVSNIFDSQQGVYQCSSTSEPITITSILASTGTSSFASNISVTQQGVYQYSSTSDPQEVIATSIPASTCTNPSVSSISDSQPGMYQYSSTSDPQEVITTSTPASTCTNPSVSNISDSQPGIYQYSSTSEPQEFITTSLSESTCTSLSALNTSISQQDVYRYSSTSEPQEVTTTSIPTSTCTNSFASNISVSQPGIYQYPSTSEPQEVSTTSIPASRCTSSFASNISVSQPSVYQYSSTSEPQEVVAASVLTSTALSVSDIPVSQQDVYQCPVTSEYQGVTTTPISALPYENSSVPFGSVPQQGFIRIKAMSELI